MNKTKIEWTDYTWNPVTGCTKVSQGCKNCYAEKMTKRFAAAMGDFKDVRERPERLVQPGLVRSPKKIFVCDVSDLFHEQVSFEFIRRVFKVMFVEKHHTFQVLTKRAERMFQFFEWLRTSDDIFYNHFEVCPHIWIGVSVEDNDAEKRIDFLRQIPARVRFLSCEPLLENISSIVVRNLWWIKWVIVGGESGHKARPMHPDWVRSLRDYCKAADVPFFFKQWGEWAPYHGGTVEELLQIIGNGGEIKYFNVPKGYRLLVDGEDLAEGMMVRLGKSKSGNTLDGKQHLEFPSL
jgi:protein gp37